MPDSAPQESLLAHREATVNGVRLHYVEAGRGPLVVLLHGFPECWHCWRRQLPALVESGFHVLAPDLRGYNLSEKPPGVASYHLELLCQDVVGMIRHAGEERAVVVGHDWGGAVAWETALRHPEAVEKLVILNAPHPEAFLRELRTFAQLRRSWYMFVFQLPWLPEWAIARRNFASFDRLFRADPARRDAYTGEDIQLLKAAMAQPGALTAAINYYRAAFRSLPTRQARNPRTEVPTLLIWGLRDRYLGPRLTEGLEPWVPNLRIERLPDASHWVQNDAP
ncbi:MAG: alpha/beta fold hydrolase, partial [Planctomycetia bacterium]|nr:alpha/beta fold hydrolase [Planctomycetia bacterium]